MELKALDQNSFEEIVYDNCESCLILFSRHDCHVCQGVHPMLEELGDDYAGDFGFYSVDVDAQAELFKRFSLRGVPQLLFFTNGAFVGKLAGAVEEADVKEMIKRTEGRSSG